MSELKKNLDELNRVYEKTAERAKVGLENTRNTLPIMEAAREEQQHALSLINGVIDKVLDLSKLLITISFPALITLFTLKRDSFDPNQYIVMTLILLIIGVVLFVIGMRYKLNHLPTYLDSSSARLYAYTQWIETALLHAKNEDLKIDLKKITKNRTSRP